MFRCLCFLPFFSSDYYSRRTFFEFRRLLTLFIFQFNLSGTEIESDSSYSYSDSESDDDIILDADDYNPSGSGTNNFEAIENENDVPSEGPSSSHYVESTDSNGNNFLFICLIFL